MDYILKDLGVAPQVCEIIKQKGITKQTFVEIINSTAGNSYEKRAELSKITGLSNDKIWLICDRIKIEIKNSQQMSSSLPIKHSSSLASSSNMIKSKQNAGGASSSKRISALLKQPANKAVLSSTPIQILQKSSFAVKKPIIPQSSSMIIKAEHVEQKIKLEGKVQEKVEPMKSPTEVKIITIDTTVADSGDSANPPSEGELHSAPAQFVTAAPVLEQVFPIVELKKIVDQGIDQIFAEDSDTESEMSLKEEQPEVTDMMGNESIEKAEMDQQPEDDQLSLSSSEDELIVKYKEQQHQIDLNQQFQIEIEQYSQSSSSSGTLSPIRSNQATQNDQIVEQEDLSEEENNLMEQSDQEIALQQEDGPSIEERQLNCSTSGYKTDIQDIPAGFIIQGLDDRNNYNEDQLHQVVQDQIMQEPEPDKYSEPEKIEEENTDFQEIENPLNPQLDTLQEQENIALKLIPQIAMEVGLPLLQKVERVDMGMQCEPWEPQVVYVEAEKKSMKNKKLQVTPERIDKSFKSPNSQQEEDKSSPMQQNDEKKRDSSSSIKGNYSASRTFVPGRTLIIPTVKQFSQSSVRTSSVQTSEFNQDQDVTLSQLLGETDFKSRPTQHSSYSQIAPQVKSILKRFHHERDDNSYTQLDSKRVKWDPNVEEKIQKPGEDSYIKRFMSQKKKQQRQGLHQVQVDDSLSSDEENQFFDEDEEDHEEEEIIIQRPQPKRRIVFIAKDENDINRETSSEEEEAGIRRNPQKAGSGTKVRQYWANGIKTWLNDMSNGKKTSSSQ